MVDAQAIEAARDRIHDMSAFACLTLLRVVIAALQTI